MPYVHIRIQFTYTEARPVNYDMYMYDLSDNQLYVRGIFRYMFANFAHGGECPDPVLTLS